MPRKSDGPFVPCEINGCTGDAGKPGTARGFCAKHYRRSKIYGDPNGKPGDRIGPVQEWVKSVALNCQSDECLIWPFYRNQRGYASWSVDGSPCLAHRVIFEMARGAPPTSKHVAAHNCFNGAGGCVNPRHVRWATQSENECDKVASGTSNRGSRHGMSRLTEEDVRGIRSLEGVMPQKEIGLKFGVSKWTVGEIIRRKRWSWLA